jgi:hypothetical protein
MTISYGSFGELKFISALRAPTGEKWVGHNHPNLLRMGQA